MESIASDKPESAKFLSQRGWAGTAWLHAPNTGAYKLSNDATSYAVALHLGLPIRAFNGAVCPCGHIFEAHLIDRHAASCNRFPKSRRHEFLGEAIDDIYTSVKATVERAEGAVGGIGPAPYGTTYSAAGEPQHVFADRYITNIPGMPTVRLVTDHTVVDPQTATYAGRAATEKVYAARVAAEVKERLYTPLLQVGDQLLVPAAETHGGIHPAFRSALGKLAGATLEDAQGGESANRGRRTQLLRAWQILLAMQLLRGRLDLLQRVRMKVYGTQVSRRVQRSWATNPAARARFLPGMFRSR